MKPQKRRRSRLRATQARLLAGLLAIGISASGAGRALGQQGLHVVPSPFINNSSLSGTAAIADNDIWAAGCIGTGSGPVSNPRRDFGSFTERWNGTSWNLLNTPSGMGFLAVMALNDGTVVAVGVACSASCSAVILEN